MLEKDIQSKIIKYLNKEGIFNFKIIAANKNGIPDLFCLYKNKPIFLEVKRKEGKVSHLQEHQMKCIETSGGLVKVVYSLEEVKEFLEKI